MPPKRLDREEFILRLHEKHEPWQVLVIGGGATGVAIALDAATRGLDTLLLERSDFGKGTSSRSTKLVHGGVRYLKQGNITLVRDALRERTLLLNNARHLVHDTPFLIPCRSAFQWLFYGIGMKVYDLLAVRNSFGKSRFVSTSEALRRSPGLDKRNLRGGIQYHDGQFDDSRLLINMAHSASDAGACLLNYVNVSELTKDESGSVHGVVATDLESGQRIEVAANCVVNAAGPFCDDVRRMDDASCAPMLAVSQGVHIVLPKEFFPGDMAMIVPKTPDGRVIFVIPWHGYAIVGTTDTAIESAVEEPAARSEEIDFLLETCGRYLARKPTRQDVTSVFTGIRPLVRGDKSANTASLSRDHVIRVSDSGLITVTGGKWTTVRKMAEDCVDRITQLRGENDNGCVTAEHRIHGHTDSPPQDASRAYYGSDLQDIESLEAQSPELAEPLDSELAIRPSDVVWAARYEMARTVEDVLARRTRSLFLNAAASIRIAPTVAELMAKELNKEDAWQAEQVTAFHEVASHYLPS